MGWNILMHKMLSEGWLHTPGPLVVKVIEHPYPIFLPSLNLAVVCKMGRGGHVVFLLLSWLLQWADFFAFFLRVASRQLHSALVYALGCAKYIRCEGPATLSTLSFCCQETSSCCHCVMHVSDILPGRDLKLTFLSNTAN